MTDADYRYAIGAMTDELLEECDNEVENRPMVFHLYVVFDEASKSKAEYSFEESIELERIMCEVRGHYRRKWIEENIYGAL